jgi:hypothetical protein
VIHAEAEIGALIGSQILEEGQERPRRCVARCSRSISRLIFRERIASPLSDLASRPILDAGSKRLGSRLMRESTR